MGEPTLQEMDKFIQQISWGNRRLLSVVLLWKQYKEAFTLLVCNMQLVEFSVWRTLKTGQAICEWHLEVFVKYF